MNLRRASLILGLMIWCAVPAALALKSDREQPIQIEADRLDVDESKGISVYRGNVRYVQGTLLLTADELQIFVNQKREVEKVIAEGNPVTFQQRLDSNQQLVKGRGSHLEYRALEQYVVLSGSAQVTQCGNEFSGALLEYFVAEELVRAAKDKDSGERVQVVIQPRGEAPQQNPCLEPGQQ